MGSEFSVSAEEETDEKTEPPKNPIQQGLEFVANLFSNQNHR